jgi:hypothetical protein
MIIERLRSLFVRAVYSAVSILTKSHVLVVLTLKWNSRVVSLVLNSVCFQVKTVSWTRSGVSKTVGAVQGCSLQDELQFVCEYE